VRRALAVIDGEHYGEVVRDALAELPFDFVAAYLVGGTEKLRGGENYGVPLVEDLEEGLEEHGPEVVVDLSDEPVLGPGDRFRLASSVLAHGTSYLGADFRLDPPALEPFPLPSIGIVGTGKRVGKTAVAGYAARLLAEEHKVVVVAMGRGGPPEPEVMELTPTVDDLLELSRAGRHAASDYLEDAALAGVATVGCRRCGGGLAGQPFTSNVSDGAAAAAALDPELVLFEGSGAAFPPVETRRRVLVAGAGQSPALVTGYLNAFRILVSDLVVLAPAEEHTNHHELRRAIAGVKDLPIVAVSMRPRPVASEAIRGRRVAFFTTAPEAAGPVLEEHLREEHGAEVVHVSHSLARRDRLREELKRVEADAYLIEIKAAAIDVVAESALERGAEVVFADNELRALPGEPDLDAELLSLAEAAAAEPVAG
jgi:cyclic 2,3-diphosphoglycerate synthase